MKAVTGNSYPNFSFIHIRRANVHVRSQGMTFCPEADGPVIDQYQFYGRIVTGRVCPAKCFLNEEGKYFWNITKNENDFNTYEIVCLRFFFRTKIVILLNIH